jgi:hypothetical protein
MQTVRILTIDGKVSDEEYLLETTKPDRKGLLFLTEVGSIRQIKVHQRRVLYDVDNNDSYAVGSNDKYRAVCPAKGCAELQEVDGRDESINCPKHGKSKLKWKDKPMSSEVNQETKDNNKMKAEAKTVDFGLFDRADLELWSKQTQFDHEKIDVKAHVLLFTGEEPRKLCFNTYNGTLGKKGGSLPLDAFLSNSCGDTKQWHSVKDLEKARVTLQKSGYEKK